MPARTVSNRGGNIIGHFPSLKLGRMVAFESLIERDFLYQLDFEQDVDWFDEQPLTISYPYRGKVSDYTPDFHVIRSGRNILVECKPQKFLSKEDNQRKFAAAQTWCATQGWTFQVITDAQLRHGYRLHNIKLLTQFARYNIKPELKRRVQAYLASTSLSVTIAEVLIAVAPESPQAAIIPILQMAFHHELILALDEAPISFNSPVRQAPILLKGGNLHERATV